jgi:hypothetical protein
VQAGKRSAHEQERVEMGGAAQPQGRGNAWVPCTMVASVGSIRTGGAREGWCVWRSVRADANERDRATAIDSLVFLATRALWLGLLVSSRRCALGCRSHLVLLQERHERKEKEKHHVMLMSDEANVSGRCVRSVTV